MTHNREAMLSVVFHPPAWRGDIPKEGDFIYTDADQRGAYRVTAVAGDKKDELEITCDKVEGWAPWADHKDATVFHWDWRIGALPRVPEALRG